MIRVICAAAHYTDRLGSRQQAEFNANKFVKAVKGKEVRGYADFTFNGRRYHLENSNRKDAIEWFAEWAASRLYRLRLEAPVLVPIPCKERILGLPGDAVVGASDRIAEAIAARVDGATVRPYFRWKEKLRKASTEKGPRDAETLYEKLTVVVAPLKKRVHVLVDDVTTKHGHVQACATHLRERDIRVPVAVCAGQSTWEHVPDPFQLEDVVVDDWEPPAF